MMEEPLTNGPLTNGEDIRSSNEFMLEQEEAIVGSTVGDEGVVSGPNIDGEFSDVVKNGEDTSDEEDDGVVIHAGRLTGEGAWRTPSKYTRTPIGKDALYTPAKIGENQPIVPMTANEEELQKLRFTRHLTAFDVDINSLDDHPWRNRNVDILDYFNYGFNEKTWMAYCEKQLRLRAEKGYGPQNVRDAAAAVNAVNVTKLQHQPVAPQHLPSATNKPMGTAIIAPPSSTINTQSHSSSHQAPDIQSPSSFMPPPPPTASNSFMSAQLSPPVKMVSIDHQSAPLHPPPPSFPVQPYSLPPNQHAFVSHHEIDMQYFGGNAHPYDQQFEDRRGYSIREDSRDREDKNEDRRIDERRDKRPKYEDRGRDEPHRRRDEYDRRDGRDYRDNRDGKRRNRSPSNSPSSRKRRTDSRGRH